MSSGDALPQPLAAIEPLACVSCRSRKLKCDRAKPACARCVRVKNECVYPGSRRKPAFKRRNVKDLEARLAQVEEYLNQVSKPTEAGDVLDEPDMSDEPDAEATAFDAPRTCAYDGATTSGQLLGLGLCESLPPVEVMEELNTHFFDNLYHYLPLIHRARYLERFYGPPNRKPPMCLQYAIWAGAAGGHPRYDDLADVFYKRARQYVEADEMKGDGEHFMTVAHAQAWAVIATYEARCMLFTRACMSSARCCRLVQMMGLDRLDKEGDDIPATLGPVASWAELEERRRVFWGAFAIDAQASISTGWPAVMRSDDILTRLPASEEAFVSGQSEKTPYLDDVFHGATYSGFSGAVVIRQMFKLVSDHIHKQKPSDQAHNMQGDFWRRHRDLDNKLSSLFVFLPDALRLPQNVRDPCAVHVHLNLHAAAICLHHTALEKAETHGLPDAVKWDSLCRLKTAAEAIVNIVQMTSHNIALFTNQLCALSLYCATTVYVYLAKANPVTGLTPLDTTHLALIINAMEAIGRTHLATCAFLQQACLDIERNGLSSSIQLPSLAQYRDIFGGPASRIPLLARSSVSRHTEAATPLPGRLPLDRPKGTPNPRNLRMTKAQPSLTGVGPVERSIRAAENNAFQAVLGAASRNVAPPDETPTRNQGPEMSPGLGNTLEENRVDLRQFQRRLSGPLWETTEGGLFSRCIEMYGDFADNGGDAWEM